VPEDDDESPFHSIPDGARTDFTPDVEAASR
jgi:hypothetical protein